MDHSMTVPYPLTAVFEHLAAPARLGDWLSEVVRVEAEAASLLGIGAAFGLTLRQSGSESAARGEMIAFEPPWLAAFGLFIGELTHVLRLTCCTCDGGTRLQVHQDRGDSPLTIDLTRLEQALLALRIAGGGDRRLDSADARSA